MTRSRPVVPREIAPGFGTMCSSVAPITTGARAASGTGGGFITIAGIGMGTGNGLVVGGRG